MPHAKLSTNVSGVTGHEPQIIFAVAGQRPHDDQSEEDWTR